MRLLNYCVLIRCVVQVVFTTDSDCEILLHLYKQHGPDFLKKVYVNGESTAI